MCDPFGTALAPLLRSLISTVWWRRVCLAFMAGLVGIAAAPASAQTPAGGQTPAGAQTPAAAQTVPQATPSAPRFDIFQYAVEGNSTLSDRAIEAAVATHMGERRTIQDVEAARFICASKALLAFGFVGNVPESARF
jgi:hemolysin activation/secretion protein